MLAYDAANLGVKMQTNLSKSLMAKPLIYDDAFITSVVPFGESDCIVRLFTRQSGRMSAFFKRGLSGKKGAFTAQAPALARVGLNESGQKLARLHSCDIDPKTLSLFSSVKAFGYSAYLAELIEKFLPEGDPAESIFELVEDSLANLFVDDTRACMLRGFELRLLDFCGYLPEMPNDDEEDQIVAFDPILSRFLFEANENSLPFSPLAVKLAKAMLIAKIGAINYEGPELIMIGRIFQSRIKLMGLSSLKSVAFLKQISLP